MGLETTSTNIDGLVVFSPQVFGDSRGYFKEIYRETAFQPMGLPPFVQENESRSKAGVYGGCIINFNPPPCASWFVACGEPSLMSLWTYVKVAQPTVSGMALS